jgi:long-chain acyl-CoA synthetase
MKHKKPIYYKVAKFNTIRELLDIAGREAGNDIAFKYKTDETISEVTYHEFIDQTENLGAALEAAGFGASHIACIGKNSYKWVVSYLTVLKSAGVFVPLDNELPPVDIFNVIGQSECSIVFYDKKYEELFKENTQKLPGVKYFIGFDRTEGEGCFLSFDKFLESGKGLDKKAYDELKSAPDDMKLLVYTSGTTGMSKGVMLTEHNIVSSIYYGMQVSTVYDTCLSVLPYHHTYESVSGLLVSLHHHSTICINDSLKAVVKNLQLYKPSYIYLVPAFVEVFHTNIMKTVKAGGKEKAFAFLMKLSNALRKVGIDLRRTFFKQIHTTFGGRLIKIVCGGAPIRPEIGEFFDNIGINLINGYGITECCPLVCANNDYFNDYHTAGLKLPCIEWRIDEPNEEGIGEICVKGDIVMLGYYKQPEMTAEVLKDGWFYTGDYGFINKYEQLVITGRKKNMIVLKNGKNIYPEEIEGYIQSLDYVTEVIVKGIRNEYQEETALLAEVFLSAEKTEKEVIKDINALIKDLPSYKHISSVLIRKEEFPKTTSKKIRRMPA